MNDNYYDLSDVEVMKWQSKIAQEHGIYGFCYYHYWFNGKLLLEKPLENMLKDKEVTIIKIDGGQLKYDSTVVNK